MGIRQFRYFVAVAEAKSFTKAAVTLRVAQPAIGMQIRKLEERLGVKLLIRHSRGVEMTEAGAVLATRALSLLQTFDDLCQEVADVGGEPRGRVVLGMAALNVVAELRSAPDVDVKAIRETLGLSQSEFAARFGLRAKTVQNWEQGRSRPDESARVLLRVIQREAAAVDRALAPV